MGSVMDQERPWEREPKKVDSNNQKIKCEHVWKFEFASLDWDHYKCEKCGEGRIS